MLLHILVVDDNPTFLRTVARFLTSLPIVGTVDCVTSGGAAIAYIARTLPDLVLMDVSMPGISGLDATRQIRSQRPAPTIIIMTLHDDIEYRIAATSVGANGFLAKSELLSCLPALLATLSSNGSLSMNRTQPSKESGLPNDMIGAGR